MISQEVQEAVENWTLNNLFHSLAQNWSRANKIIAYNTFKKMEQNTRSIGKVMKIDYSVIIIII